MNRGTHTTIALALALASLLASGCGGNDDPTVDPAQIEPQLVENLSADVGVDPAQVSLDCPSGEPAEEGHEFDCELTAPDGTTATVRVTVSNVETSDDEVDYDVDAVVPKGQFD